MIPESLIQAISKIQEDYRTRQKAIEDYIPQSGMTDILQQRIFDYKNFIRSLETIKEELKQIEIHPL